MSDKDPRAQTQAHAADAPQLVISASGDDSTDTIYGGGGDGGGESSSSAAATSTGGISVVNSNTSLANSTHSTLLIPSPPSSGSVSPARMTTSLPPARVPAAGIGTRVTPRPVPRSSSSLRHIAASGKARTSSFGAPVPEDRDPSSIEYYEDTATGAGQSSIAENAMRAFNRKAALELEQEQLFAEEDEEDDEEDEDEEEEEENGREAGRRRSTGREDSDEDSSDEDEEDSIAGGESQLQPGGAHLSPVEALSDQQQSVGQALVQSHPQQTPRSKGKNRASLDGSAGAGDASGTGTAGSGEEDMLIQPSRRRARRRSSLLRAHDFHLTDSASSESEVLAEEDGPEVEADLGGGLALSDASRPAEASSYLAAKTQLARRVAQSNGVRPSSSSNTGAGSGLDLDSPPISDGSASRRPLATPGPYFPQHTLQTPMVETAPRTSGAGDGAVQGTPEMEPRQRLEWQTMLHSVLGSEVLRSETKRITSVDAPEMSRSEVNFQRWLEMRAYLRGRGHTKASVEAEAKMLAEGWPRLMQEVIAAVKACRNASTQRPKGKQKEGSSDSTTASAVATAATADVSDSTEAADERMNSVQEEKERVFQEVGQLLERVDQAEAQFPSQRRLIEEIPEWGSQEIQGKLAALYSWYNIFSSLRLQIKVLQKWTGSEKLEITAQHSSHPNVPAPSTGADGEEGTFVERLMKENNLKSTFEKRTLTALNALLVKAREAIKTHHAAFGEMNLPSFEPELVQLIGFPPSLMEGALTLRLDYAGKLKDPSVLIVDSLTDDIRSALALACRVKLKYIAIMVPDPENGWELPQSLDDGYDAVLRDALRFFFRLLNFKLKGSVFFKETEILEPEWLFLSTAVSVINGGDVIVAKSVTKIVNKVSGLAILI